MMDERHKIEFGERVNWTAPAGAAELYAWVKVNDADAAIRWRRVAGWDIANNQAVSIPDAPHGRGVPISSAAVSLDWSQLLGMFDGYDPELLQITTLDADGKLFSRDVYRLPNPSSTNAATIAAQEREVLKKLLDMRRGLSDLKAGHIKVRDPSGTEVERMEISVLDRRIAEIRSRIAWFEDAVDGNPLPGTVYW